MSMAFGKLNLKHLQRIPVWSTRHQDELEFQEQKRHKAMLQAFAEGSLLPEEVSDGIRREAGNQKVEFEKGVAARERKDARQNVQLAGFSVESLHWGCFSGKRVYFQDCEPRTQAMRSHGCWACADIFSADVVVVPNNQLSTLNPRRASTWLAALLGVTLMNRDMLELRPTGRQVKYVAVGRQKKCALHISDGFQAKHPHVADIVERVVATRSCQWHIVSLQVTLEL